MTEKRPLKVFLCHAHADRDAVRTLYTRLTNDGVDAWLDKEKLLPGQDWELEIKKAVHEADVVVVCLSKQFVQAGVKHKEVKWALDTAMEKPEGEIFIIPARLEECESPNSLSKWHWVDLFTDSGYRRLMLAFNEKAKRIDAFFELQKRYLVSNESDKRFASDIAIQLDKPRKRMLWTSYVYLFIGFVILVLGFILFSSLINRPISNGPFPEDTLSQILITPTFTVTVEPSATITPSPIPNEILDAHDVPMMLVSEGEFIMGSAIDDEQPVHEVYLDAFYLDKYEVTNFLYSKCVNVGACLLPENTHYFENSSYIDHPVTYIDWYMAKEYCEWRGARLPTEAEWEKVARGIDGRTYPWGETIDCDHANYRSTDSAYCVGDSMSIGSYEDGQSVYGIYDLAGNVAEWVSSLNIKYPYDASDGRENLNSNDSRIIRGGSWNNRGLLVRSTDRAWNDPSQTALDYGFRCAKDAP